MEKAGRGGDVDSGSWSVGLDSRHKSEVFPQSRNKIHSQSIQKQIIKIREYPL